MPDSLQKPRSSTATIACTMFCEIWFQWSIAGVLAGASGPIGLPLTSYM